MTMRLRASCMQRLMALLLSALLSAKACAAGWPELPLPAGAQVVDVGDTMRINGLSMQVRGFLSPQPVADLAAWYRSRLGSPLIASQHRGKTILGQARGAYYLTVQLQAAGMGTRGLVAQSDLAAMMGGQGPASIEEEGWRTRLPPGTRILGLVESRSHDGMRRMQHLMLQSRGRPADSGQALSRMLAEDRYGPARSMPSSAPPGLVLHFQGPGRDATAVLTENADGTTSTVLSTSVPIESLR